VCCQGDAAERAGLYVHVPFCRSICPYCDFSVLIAAEDRRREYLDALRLESLRAASDWPLFDTIYLGGGTPSVLETDQLETLLATLNGVFPTTDDCLLYLEVNPENVKPETARTWRELGFEFISLGVQSFDDDVLEYLGRNHSGESAARAAEIILTEGFGTVSADLIFGIPGTDLRWWQSQLERAADLGLNHLSCYQLTIHRHTVFGKRRDRGEVDELGETEQADQYLFTHRVLADRAFEAYEVSNFARGGKHRSRHNQKYWSHQPYLGLGPSAHSYRNGRRWWNRPKLRLWKNALYAGKSPVEGEEQLTHQELALEAILLGLRTVAGVDLDSVERRFRVAVLEPNWALLERWREEGLIELDDRRVRPTRSGLAVADGLVRGLEIVQTNSSVES
jgi:oxygen-independent coproporphyrinogen-3 oxidase